MAGQYTPAWDEHVTAINQKPPPINPVGPDGRPISYQTNVNRTKTQKWVEAKKADYGGDEWGEDEYDDYEDEPPPPISKQPAQPIVTRPRQSSLSADHRRTDSFGPPPSEPRSSSQMERRPPQLQFQNSHSQGPYPGQGDARTYSLTRAPMHPPGPGDARTYSLTQPPSFADDSSRTRSLDSSVRPNKFMPNQRQQGPASPTHAHTYRGSNLSDELPPPGALDARPGSSASTRSGGPMRKLIRPSDIYKKLAEQKEQARRSQESDRPISDSLSSGSGPRLETSPPVANAVPVAPTVAAVTAPEVAPIPATAPIIANPQKTPSPPPALAALPAAAPVPAPVSVPAPAPAPIPNPVVAVPDSQGVHSHHVGPPAISKSNPYSGKDMPVVDLSSLQRPVPDPYEQRPHQYGGQLETLTESAEEKSIMSFKMHDDDDGGRKSSETARLKSVSGSLARSVKDESARSIAEEPIVEEPKRFSRSPELPDLNFGDQSDFRASLWAFPSQSQHTDDTPLPPLPAKNESRRSPPEVSVKHAPSLGLSSVVDRAFDDANRLNPTTPTISPGSDGLKSQRSLQSMDETVSEPPTPLGATSAPGSAGPDPKIGPARAPAIETTLYPTVSHEVLLSAVTPTTPTAHSASSTSTKPDDTPKESKADPKNLVLDLKGPPPSNAEKDPLEFKPAALSPPPPPLPAKNSPTEIPSDLAHAVHEQAREEKALPQDPPMSPSETSDVSVKPAEPIAVIPNSPVELPIRHSKQGPVGVLLQPKAQSKNDEHPSDEPAVDQLELSDSEEEAEVPAPLASKHAHSASKDESVQSEENAGGAPRQSIMSDLLNDYDGYWALQEDEFGNRQSVYVGPPTDEPPPPPPLPLDLVNKTKVDQSPGKQEDEAPSKPAPLDFSKEEPEPRASLPITPSEVPLPVSAGLTESPAKETPARPEPAEIPTITTTAEERSTASPQRPLRHRFSWEADSGSDDEIEKSEKLLDEPKSAEQNGFDPAALRSSVTLEVVPPPEQPAEDDTMLAVPSTPKERPLSEQEKIVVTDSPESVTSFAPVAVAAAAAVAVAGTAVAVNVAGQSRENGANSPAFDRGLGIENVPQAAHPQISTANSSEHNSPVVPAAAAPGPLNRVSDTPLNQKLPSFREILSIPSPEQRIKLYTQSAHQLSHSPSGLGQWITVMSANIAPEHIQGYRDGAAPVTPGAVTQQKPYYEQYLDAYSHPAPPQRDEHHGHHPPPIRSQMPSKSKDFLHTANKFFTKGKNKLRGGVGGRADDDYR